jgi:hypothetical protein
MNYIKIYNSIIDRASKRNKTKNDGLHRHRILPGFENGLYEESNICLLTRKEHRIIHKLRWKIYGKWQDLSSYVKLGGKNCDPWNKGIKTGQIPWNKNKNTKFLGMSYEEIYGKEKASYIKEMRKDQLQKYNHLQTKIVKEKRKKSIISYYENNESKLKNVKKSDETKKKLSISMKNKSLKERCNLTDEEYVAVKKEMSQRAMGNKSTKGKKWFNNGKTNRLFFPNEVPDSSWEHGRIKIIDS